MKNIIQSLKGTRDFYPEEMAVRTWLYNNIRNVSESYGYQEYEGPLLESLALYAAKSGDELVKEQSFVFPDRSGELITLRPELTPTLVRMVAERQNQLIYPLRWWSYGPFWRYERPQRGRTREFFQWNIDLIGVGSPEADAEIASIIAVLFRNLGLGPDEVQVIVNNRRLIEDELRNINIAAAQHLNVFRLIDRKEKLSPEKWDAYAYDLGLNKKQLAGLKTILENYELWKKSEELTRFFDAIQSFEVNEYIHFDPKIIRGLDYYTGTVYEGKAVDPDIRRAIFGGGRYDNLLADVGGDPLPGTGFAMGDVVITLLLEKLGRIPNNLGISPAPVFVTIFDENSILDSFALSNELRATGLKVSCYPEAVKLGKQFKYASRIGAIAVVILGPDEQAQGKVSIKDLRTAEQVTIPRERATLHIKQLLDGDVAS
jgi:histidyl-tRNA synthetase